MQSSQLVFVKMKTSRTMMMVNISFISTLAFQGSDLFYQAVTGTPSPAPLSQVWIVTAGMSTFLDPIVVFVADQKLRRTLAMLMCMFSRCRNVQQSSQENR